MFPTEPAPEVIGAYKILRRLSGSGSAKVYLGRRDGPRGFQRICALKLVPNTAEGDPGYAEELAREAAICAKLNHPTLVRMFDFFEHEDKLVLVLEHVEGANLHRLLQHLGARQQKLSDAAIYYLCHRVSGALAHAHATTDEHGSPTPVIHRNLHPENIVIGWDGQVRLTGFGIGKILGRTPDTVAGVVKGTPGYMAPEQARGDRVTTKADVYGLGLLLWSLLSGRRPPDDGTKPPAIASIRHEVPRPIVSLLDAALAPQPDDRKTSCAEIEQTLAKVARPEKGKAELVMRIQSAHATIEVEDADPEEDRRPTIPVKGKGAQTTRPGNEITKRFARALLGKDALTKDASSATTQKPEAPPSDAGDKAQDAPRAEVEGSVEPSEPSEAITIPVPAEAPVVVQLKSETWKPALPDRETFGRLFEAAKRASEREAQDAEVDLEPIGTDDPPTIQRHGSASRHDLDAAQLEGPADAASQPMIAGDAASAALQPMPGELPARLPSAIVFGPPPPAPIDMPMGPYGAPVSLPREGMPLSFGSPPELMPEGAAAMGYGPLPPPPLAASAVGAQFGLPAGGQQPSSPGIPTPATVTPVVQPGRSRSVSPFFGARSLSTAGTIAVSAITATLVAAVWIFVARRDRALIAAKLPLLQKSVLEAAAVVPPPSSPPSPQQAATPEPQAPSTPLEPEPPHGTTQSEIDLGALPAGHGLLTVAFAEPANVYVTGRPAGPANAPLVVRCGRWFVRLARPGGNPRAPSWVTAGTTVHVACQGATRVTMRPSLVKPARASKP